MADFDTTRLDEARQRALDHLNDSRLEAPSSHSLCLVIEAQRMEIERLHRKNSWWQTETYKLLELLRDIRSQNHASEWRLYGKTADEVDAALKEGD